MKKLALALLVLAAGCSHQAELNYKHCLKLRLGMSKDDMLKVMGAPEETIPFVEGKSLAYQKGRTSYEWSNPATMPGGDHVSVDDASGKVETVRCSNSEITASVFVEPPAPSTNVVAGKGGIEWVPLPGGTFMMGSADEPVARPVHQVTIAPFQLAKAPVTFRQYGACVAAGACTPAHVSDGTCFVFDGNGPAGWSKIALPAAFQGDDQPAVCVTWEQAGDFSKWVGGRLPSESEWEYAARSGGKAAKYPWGNEDATCDRAVVSTDKAPDAGYTRASLEGTGCGRKSTWPVCSKPKGNTEQGLCDMAGNVWEWVQDLKHFTYAGAPADGSAWEASDSKSRMKRGGSWFHDGGFALATARGVDVPAPPGGDAAIGFRPARSFPSAAQIPAAPAVAVSSGPAPDLHAAIEAYRKKDFVKAMTIAGALAQNGDPDAQMLAGMIFLNGAAPGQEHNSQGVAMMWFYKASRQKNAEAQAAYAATLMTTATPPQTIVDEIKLAADAGSPAGQLLQADVLLKGTYSDLAPVDEEEGDKLLLSAAKAGDPSAQLSLARRRQTATKDLVEAYRWALVASRAPLVDKFADPMHSLSTAWTPEQRTEAQKLLRELKSVMKPAQLKDAESRAAKP